MATGNIGNQELQVPAGTIKIAATQFLLWAHQQGLLTPEAYYPGDGIGQPVFGEDGVLASGIAALRQRQIRFVGVSEATQTISVFFRRAAPGVREQKSLPKTCNGYALRYHQGNPNLVSPTTIAQAANCCAVHAVGASSFYTCGSSISVGNDRGAGTLGCLVVDAHGTIFGLSNNHVSGSCNYAPAGLPILAPGILDVTPSNPWPFTLGLHHHQLPMLMGDPSSVDVSMNSDAAVFSLAPNAPVSSMQRNHYDTPTSIMELVPGMAVEKVGRSSDLTTGVVHSEVIGAIPISYSASQYEFAGAVYFEPMFLVHGVGDRFSEAGDSGSLVTHVDASGIRHAVGLVVAGCDDSSAPGGKRSFVLPLRSILERLHVTLVAGHNC